MQHFHRTQSIFSKFSETFPLPHPHRICWPPQLAQNRLSPRRSTSTTLQLRASLHIFLHRIWHKLCNISIELGVYFPNLARPFPYHTQIKYAGPLNLDKSRRGDRRFCRSWGGQHIRCVCGRGNVSLNLENILWVLWKCCICCVRYVVEICAN